MTSLLHILVSRKLRAQQVDFPDEVEDRSCKGALHLRPSSIIKITQSEYDYINENFPEISDLMRIQETKKKVDTMRSKPISYTRIVSSNDLGTEE